MKKYITYITYYKGNLLPPFYIGSSYEKKVLNGYNGSIRSKKYKEIYKKEQKENKYLFKTRILSYHETREEALKEELRLQKKHNVVKNEKYFNESYASINGYFGRDISGKLHPMYGKEHSKESKKKMNISAKARGINRKGPHSEETKQKMSANRKGKGPEYLTEEHKKAISKGLKGKEKSREHCNNISKAIKESEKFKGAGNPNAKIMTIFNELDEIMYTCEGNFYKLCENNNLPSRQLYESRRTGNKVFSTKNGKTIANKKGLSKFIGWYMI